MKGKGSHTIHVIGNGTVAEGLNVKLKGGVLDTLTVSQDIEIEKGGIKFTSKASAATHVVIDEIELDDGPVVIKGTRGDDRVTITSSTLDGGVTVKLGPGNDQLTVSGLISFESLKVDGGPDGDVFNYNNDPDNIDGPIKSKNFEIGNGPGTPDDD
jgi:hypothetical protein